MVLATAEPVLHALSRVQPLTVTAVIVVETNLEIGSCVFHSFHVTSLPHLESSLELLVGNLRDVCLLLEQVAEVIADSESGAALPTLRVPGHLAGKLVEL